MNHCLLITYKWLSNSLTGNNVFLGLSDFYPIHVAVYHFYLLLKSSAIRYETLYIKATDQVITAYFISPFH
jgi:hypothetical protein